MTAHDESDVKNTLSRTRLDACSATTHQKIDADDTPLQTAQYSRCTEMFQELFITSVHCQFQVWN